MREYPAAFRLPEHVDLSGRISPGLRRTGVPAALRNQLKQFNSPSIALELPFAMSNDEYVTWYDWVRNFAHDWFVMPVVSPHDPVLITSDHLVRFISPVNYRKQGDNWVSLSVTAEIRPADVADADVPESTYDWIVAGTPASPASDWIVAGTPASPAADWVRSHLYDY